MADRINNDNATYGNKYYILTSNVDLSGNDWEPILSFQGNFDGRGRTISNTMFTGGTNIGFFQNLLATAIISNLCMTGVNISGT
ncbi:MAG: hypothetical protein LBT31_04840, partial [Synergistaceae bacterium]|nr:hypothetical protein [Synergistaceae bacterium]